MRSILFPALSREIPVLLLAPLGRDARLLAGAIADRIERVDIVEDEVGLERALAVGDVGVLVMTQEALGAPVMRALEGHLEAQAPWAELPIVLLVDAVGHTVLALTRFQNALPRSKPLVLQRPIRLSELGSAVETMCQSRLRQYALRDYIERQETLRRELNHRVKNILATVGALHGLTAATAPDLETYVESFEGRLEAMAGVHQVLHEGDYGATELAAIAEVILAPYRGGGSEVEIDGELTRLGPEIAQGLALVLHELATNASKYGALSGTGGRVCLTWARVEDRFEARWTERGGPAIEGPAPSGYGIKFIGMTMRGYGGEARFDYAEGGLAVTLVAPLPNVGAAPA